MELIICFGLAVSLFSLLIALIVGLVSAPTPILLGILVIGMMFTQKSIDKLTSPDTIFMEEKDREKIEKVEVKQGKNDGDVFLKSRIYRGIKSNDDSSHLI